MPFPARTYSSVVHARYLFSGYLRSARPACGNADGGVPARRVGVCADVCMSSIDMYNNDVGKRFMK